MAWDYNGQALIYESNSRTALSLTLHGADHTHHYFPLISRIRSFLHHPWELSFQHEFREANYCADWLAKLGASSANHPLVFYSCPIAMAHL